jgi:acetyl-CoA carboxylase carboxyltransferase component
VIARLLGGDGQFRVGDDVVAALNELDEQAAQAVEAGDEENVHRLLGLMAKTVRERGERLADDDLSPSDLIIPPDDLSLEEAKELFSGDGLIPDLPVG